MAVAFDTASVINNTTSGSHTTSGSDRFLVVFVFILSGSGSPTVSGITYNGVALTQKTSRARNISGSNYIAGEVWYLDDPASGSNTVSITFGASYTKTVALVMSYTSAAAVGTNAGAADGNSSTPAATFTTGASSSLIIGAASVRGGDTDPFAPGTSTTERQDGATGTNASTDLGYTSGDEAATGGSDTIDWTATVADHWVALAIELTAASGDQTITATGITSLEAFGSPLLELFITPSGITSLEAFGVAQIDLVIFPSGITSLEAFGTLLLELFITPSGIVSGEGFGTAVVAVDGAITILPDGIASLEAFGSHTITPGEVVILASSIASLEAFGTAQIDLVILPTGIASLEAFGSHTFTPGAVIITPSGIASLEAFGTAIVALAGAIIYARNQAVAVLRRDNTLAVTRRDNSITVTYQENSVEA